MLKSPRFRWLIEQREDWQWDSRGDFWFKNVSKTPPRLQYAIETRIARGSRPGYVSLEPVWRDVPTEVVVTQPAGPEPKD